MTCLRNPSGDGSARQRHFLFLRYFGPGPLVLDAIDPRADDTFWVIIIFRGDLDWHPGCRLFRCNRIAYRWSAVNGHPNGTLNLLIRCLSSKSSVIGGFDSSRDIVFLPLLHFAELLGEKLIYGHFDLESFSAVTAVVRGFVFVFSSH